MIDLSEVYQWMNIRGPSYLGTTSQIFLSKILDKNLPEEQVSAEIFRAKQAIEKKGTLEYPELLIRCAMAKEERNNLHEAILLCREAIKQFTINDDHRTAVSLWILGTLEIKNNERQSGYENWFKARKMFGTLFAATKNEPTEKEIVLWYESHLQIINQEMALTIEECIYWLTLFRTTHLGIDLATAQKKGSIQDYKGILLVKRNMETMLRSGQFSSAYHLAQHLQDLSKSSFDYLEYPEVLVICAQVYYQMGNLQDAITLLGNAIPKFSPGSHQQAVSRWMRGLIIWNYPQRRTDAITDWQQSIEEFMDLQSESIKKNRKERISFYHQLINTLTVCLDKQLRTQPIG